jgi:hypothetical protein
VETWLTHKLKLVQDLFEDHITGGMLRVADESITAARQRIEEIEHHLKACTKGVAS